MAVQQAFKGDITLAFDYKETETSKVIREKIAVERISYVMIEKKFENVNILPVIYISLNLSSDMYSKVVNTFETSKFYLNIKKRNSLSKTSIKQEVVNDIFSYVTSSTAPNYSEVLNSQVTNDNSFKNIIVGLVSTSMINELRKSYNGIYNNITQSDLVNLALKGISNNIIKEKLAYDKKYDNYLVPPITSRYKLLCHIFNNNPFYNSMFTFFMDFKNTYLVSKNGKSVDAKDGNPSNVIIDIKDYTAEEAYKDGFSIQNGAYVIYVNASDTNPIVNNATNKVSNNIVAYSDSNDVQNLSVDINNSNEITTKTSYIRSNNAAVLKNELQNTGYMIEILKQNVDSEIFTPNKSFSVSNYTPYAKYDGKYILSYLREFYYFTQGGEFTITCNVGLKLTADEEIAKSKSDTTENNKAVNSYTSKKSKSSSKKNVLKSKQANRNVNAKDNKSSNASSARKK